MKRNKKTYIFWIIIIGAFAIHYTISLTSKSDEVLFLMIAIATLAVLITNWIFSKFGRRH